MNTKAYRVVGKSTVEDCQLISLPKIADPRGNLTFLESERHVPFAFRRVYWIYDVPGGERRGGHAYRQLQEFAIALSGSFEFHVSDGQVERIFTLNRPYFGLYVPHMIWRRIENFSTNAVCLILASEQYSEPDYIRDEGAFTESKAATE